MSALHKIQQDDGRSSSFRRSKELVKAGYIHECNRSPVRGPKKENKKKKTEGETRIIIKRSYVCDRVGVKLQKQFIWGGPIVFSPCTLKNLLSN